jgi:hypothetical protein
MAVEIALFFVVASRRPGFAPEVGLLAVTPKQPSQAAVGSDEQRH